MSTRESLTVSNFWVLLALSLAVGQYKERPRRLDNPWLRLMTGVELTCSAAFHSLPRKLVRHKLQAASDQHEGWSLRQAGRQAGQSDYSGKSMDPCLVFLVSLFGKATLSLTIRRRCG